MENSGHARPNQDIQRYELPTELNVPYPVHVLDELVGWSPRTRRRQIAAGRLRVIRIGRRVYVTEEELRRVLAEGTHINP